MQRLLTISWLTWKAAFRFRLFWVIAVLLIGSVVVLPLVIRDDGTARGFTQILLTYTLSVVVALLGLCTLWLSCGTLARDIEENQMQTFYLSTILFRYVMKFSCECCSLPDLVSFMLLYKT